MAKNKLTKGDFFYPKGEKYNSEGNYNHISYFQARGLMLRVPSWREAPEGWSDSSHGGYIGQIQEFELTLRMCDSSCYLDKNGRRRPEKLRVVDQRSRLVLATYHTEETSDKFWELQNAQDALKQESKDNALKSSLIRISKILGR